MATYTLRESLHDGIYSLRHNYKFFLVFTILVPLVMHTISFVFFNNSLEVAAYSIAFMLFSGHGDLILLSHLFMLCVQFIFSVVIFPTLVMIPTFSVCFFASHHKKVSFRDIFHMIKTYFVPGVLFSLLTFLVIPLAYIFIPTDASIFMAALFVLFKIFVCFFSSYFFICMIGRDLRLFPAIKSAFSCIFSRFSTRIFLHIRAWAIPLLFFSLLVLPFYSVLKNMIIFIIELLFVIIMPLLRQNDVGIFERLNCNKSPDSTDTL